MASGNACILFFLNKFINEWIPKEEAYFSKFNIVNNVDIIIQN